MTVVAYDDMPQPSAICEAWTAGFEPWEEEFDRDALLDELAEGIAPAPYVLDDKLHRHEWGASGAGLDVFLGVSTTIGGVAGAVYLVDRFMEGVRARKGTVARREAGRAAYDARRWVVQLIEVDAGDVQVTKVSTGESGAEVRLAVGSQSYVVTMGENGLWMSRE